MTATQRLEKIQEFLSSNADDRFINLVFGMVQAEKEDEVELSDAHKAILDQRIANFRANPNQGETWESVKASLLSK